MRKYARIAAPLAAAGIAALGFGFAGPAGAATVDYQATLNPLNHATASGSFMLQLNGDQATITEHVSGLAASFMGAPYPHVQHIHGGAAGACPSTSADKNGDGVVSTVEGQPSYGPIQTTLSVSGDTSPSAGTNVKIAPSGASFDYSRTITLDAATVQSLTSGKAVVVVHGLDPTTLSKQAQGEKSELVPSLPLAATSPALCGSVTAMPAGAAQTGGGSTAGLQNEGLLGLGGGLILVSGAVVAVGRRRSNR